MSDITNDLLYCQALFSTLLDGSDAAMRGELSRLGRDLMGGCEGGFFAEGTPVPAQLSLQAQLPDDSALAGVFAFAAPPALSGRLTALRDLVQKLLDRRQAERRQSQILGQIHDSVITMDLTGFITGWNPGAERVFGYTAEEAIGRNVLFLYADAEEDDLLGDVFLEQGGRKMEVRRRRKSGEEFWASLSLSLVRDPRGNAVGLVGYLTDITDRLESEQRLRLHARIFDHSEEAILITDTQQRIISVNPALCRITGYRQDEVQGKTPRLFKSGRHDRDFYQAMWSAIRTTGHWQGEIWDKRKSGEEFPQWASINAVRNSAGEVTHYFSVFSDITERKRSEDQINYLAYFDSLTGLPNRAQFFSLLERTLVKARREGHGGAILFVDLNRFKPINDSLGHDVGDLLLKGVGQRFRSALRDSDLVARIGGDEFVVNLIDVGSSEHVGVVAQKLLDALDAPFFLSNQELRVGASIGISLYPGDGMESETLLRYADIAMYRAKQIGDSGFAFYSHEMNQRSLERLKLEAGLRKALERNELLLHYQPKLELDSGRVIGVEALVRWQHPERGMVPPGEFIPVAEESGLITRIGDWVLDAACAQARCWLERGLPVMRVAVNLSARQFTPGLAEKVRGLLEQHDLPATWLELEITESMLMHSADEVIAMMDEVVGLGVSLSLDDFGTGYSSLSYLKRFPIETLKIDRSFIQGTPADSDDCAITSTIVSMAKQLKHRVIAEGVETQGQVDFLKTLGCEEIQGYVFSPPLPAARLEALLRGSAVFRL